MLQITQVSKLLMLTLWTIGYSLGISQNVLAEGGGMDGGGGGDSIAAFVSQSKEIISIIDVRTKKPAPVDFKKMLENLEKHRYEIILVDKLVDKDGNVLVADSYEAYTLLYEVNELGQKVKREKPLIQVLKTYADKIKKGDISVWTRLNIFHENLRAAEYVDDDYQISIGQLNADEIIRTAAIPSEDQDARIVYSKTCDLHDYNVNLSPGLTALFARKGFRYKPTFVNASSDVSLRWESTKVEYILREDLEELHPYDTRIGMKSLGFRFHLVVRDSEPYKDYWIKPVNISCVPGAETLQMFYDISIKGEAYSYAHDDASGAVMSKYFDICLGDSKEKWDELDKVIPYCFLEE